MRRIYYLMAVVLMLAACTENYTDHALMEAQQTLSASAPGGDNNSRIAIQEPKDNKSALYWSANDAFVAFGNEGQQFNYVLTSGENSAHGMFGCEQELTAPVKHAAFPLSNSPVMQGAELTMTLPNRYGEGSNSQNLPMWGTVNETKVRFAHLAGVLRINVNDDNLKGYDRLEIASNEILAGDFVMTVGKDTHLKKNNDKPMNKSVVIDFDDNKDTYYIPLPVQHYSNIKIYGTKGTKSDLILDVKDREVICGVIYNTKTLLHGTGSPKAWDNFVADNADNVLLDYSFAGYDHGESVPFEVNSWGYQIVNVDEHGLVPNDGKSDREAFVALLNDYGLTTSRGNAKARIVLQFSEGEYILHDDNDNTPAGCNTAGKGKSSSIIIYGGHFIIRGAGRGKTKLVMKTPNLPSSNKMYSSPDMIVIKSGSDLAGMGCMVQDNGGERVYAKGGFSVKVNNTAGINVGDWVCLYMNSHDQRVIDAELYPHKWQETMKELSTNPNELGVLVKDYHQVASVDKMIVTFKEPLMHEIDLDLAQWEIKRYPHFENVGIEDLTFVGDCVDDFQHHRSWVDDGAYKPIAFNRIVNSWMRRVEFESVSEAFTISNSANVSVYDVTITGKRGHSAIRSAGSSRVFIGAVTDRTRGPMVSDRGIMEDEAGQYHACGSSKPSMGAVIWNVKWGVDGCFESHASQPRATLIDHCSGGFIQSRQGGAGDKVPNHLNDLTIWNMYVERTGIPSNKGEAPAGGEWDWWRMGRNASGAQLLADNWKFVRPIVVGIHGVPVKFYYEPFTENGVEKNKQMKYEESTGTKVEVDIDGQKYESLYEAQLVHRLKKEGKTSAWPNVLKALR